MISPNNEALNVVPSKLTIRSSQTILDGADTPKKGKPSRKIPEVSALEKENLTNDKERSSAEGGRKRKPKRTLEADDGFLMSSSQAKKAKKATKAPRKKKVVALAKGQKTLNQFFRV